MAKHVNEVVLGGNHYYFVMSRAEAVEFQLREKLEDLVDTFSVENVLKFFRSFIRASYRTKTFTGFVEDDSAAVDFLNSADYDDLLRQIFDTPFPEDVLAKFINKTAWNVNNYAQSGEEIYNIFDEESNK